MITLSGYQQRWLVLLRYMRVGHGMLPIARVMDLPRTVFRYDGFWRFLNGTIDFLRFFTYHRNIGCVHVYLIKTKGTNHFITDDYSNGRRHKEQDACPYVEHLAGPLLALLTVTLWCSVGQHAFCQVLKSILSRFMCLGRIASREGPGYAISSNTKKMWDTAFKLWT